MKKKLLIVLLPVVLMMAGAFGVWANEQNTVQPGCNKCVKAEKAAPCANCPNAAAMEKGAPCANCPNAAAMEKGTPCPNCKGAGTMKPGCGNCAKMNGAAATPPAGAAGCDKCVKAQPAPEQPARKGCCDKSQPYQQL